MHIDLSTIIGTLCKAWFNKAFHGIPARTFLDIFNWDSWHPHYADLLDIQRYVSVADPYSLSEDPDRKKNVLDPGGQNCGLGYV